MTRPSLSVQLYSVRAQLGIDPLGTAGRLRTIGFHSVEPYGLTEQVDQLDLALASSGLSAPTAHVSLLDGAHAAAFEAAQRLGVSILIEPFVPEEQWTNREGVAALAVRLTAIADAAADYGLRVGYHNHWWELETLIDGTPALEVFADHLGDRVVLEVDTYWSAVGGVDPIGLLDRLGARVAALHIKDGPATRDTMKQLPAGQGVLPIEAILAAAPQARAVVEFDDYSGDIFDGLAQSFAFLTSHGVEA